MPSDKKQTLTADDLEPLVEKLPLEEVLLLVSRLKRITRSLSDLKDPGDGTGPARGLPDMTEFHRSFSSPPYPGNAVLEMREEDEQ